MNRVFSKLLIAPLLLLSAAGCRDQNNTETPDLATATPDLSEASQDLSAVVDAAPTVDSAKPTADLSPIATPTEFVVVRVGDGAAALTAAAAAVFLERHKISDGSLVGTSIALPTTVNGAQRRLTLSGSSISEGALSLSEDRRFLIIAGYDAEVGRVSLPDTDAVTVNRVVGVINSANVVNTTTAANFLDATNVRGATSTGAARPGTTDPDKIELWVSGLSGMFYTTLGSTDVPVALNSVNARALNIFYGQLYATSASGAFRGVNTLNDKGNGTPQTATAATRLSGFETQTTASPYGFVAFDRDATAGIDVIYTADDSTTGRGVQRWSLSAGKWKLDGTMSKGLNAGVRGITGFITGNNVTLLATTTDSPARVVRFVDNGTTLEMIDFSLVTTAGTNTAYRGIAFPPQ